MTQLLMPKATAVWLIDNSALTFEQIGAFCNLHPLEVQSIADGEAGIGIQGYDPVINGQITRAELDRCEADSTANLKLAESNLPVPNRRTKGPRYVPVAKRGDKPDAIAWLLKHAPDLKDTQIAKLVGTTKDTINKVRERSHWNSPNIQARHPVLLGLCNQLDLDQAIVKAGGPTRPVEAQVENIAELP